MIQNKLNFIRWSGFGGAVSNTLPEYPVTLGYARDIGRQFGPLFYPGQHYSFYINFINPILLVFFPFYIINIRRFSDGVTVASNIGTLTKDIINPPSPAYNIAISIPSFPNLTFGWYEFVIYNSNNSQLVAVSNPVEVAEAGSMQGVSKIFYRNSVNRNNTNYEGLPAFYNIFHLPVTQVDFNIETERQQYRNVTNRKFRNLKSYSDPVLKLECFNFDIDGHKAMAEVFDHDTVFINKTFIIPKDAYQVENRLLSVLSKATISVYIDETKVNPNT